LPTVRVVLIALLVLTLASLPVAGRCGGNAPARTLRVLAWPGYADADVVRAFEQRHDVRVDVTLVGSDEDLWIKISGNGGNDYDVLAINTAELQRCIDRGLVQPIDVRQIPNTRRQLPRFRNVDAIAGLTRDGHQYGVPYTYSEMGLIYDRAQFAEPPQSIAELWNPRLKGRVLAYDGAVHNFSLAAIMLGSASPFRIDEAAWPRAVDQLIALRRNALAFYKQPDESARLFVAHRIALLFANYGTQQLQLIKAAGADVGYAIPWEGTLAWLDCWAVARGARDIALANAWIDYMLDGAVSGLLVTRQGLANTIEEPAWTSANARLLWLEPAEDTARREKLWSRVVSGDRASKVMAP
jgi:putative spermidine/putrescine transport system substrate-binding protein